MLVSAIIPTRDRAASVVRAVASALAQRDVEIEVIVVDDGSTDDTEEQLGRFGDRIRYWRREHAGVSAARNHGASVAKGDWLAFLDSDDEWLPDKTRAQLELHRREPALDASQTGELWIRNGVRVNACKHHAKPRGDIFAASLERCLVSPSAVMLRRSTFADAGGFDERLPVCEDYDLWLRLSRRMPFGLVDQPLMIKHGGHADQLSARYWGMDRFRVESLTRLLTGELSDEQRRAAIHVLTAKCRVLANGARRRGRDGEAERYEAIAARFGDA